MKNRIWYKWHAKILGYFWLPCPLCGQMFSGYEWDRSTKLGLPTSIPQEAQPRDMPFVASGRGICPDCVKSGRGWEGYEHR